MSDSSQQYLRCQRGTTYCTSPFNNCKNSVWLACMKEWPSFQYIPLDDLQ